MSEPHISERLRNNCSCNFPDTPCGAEEECRNAFEAADRIEKLETALRKIKDLHDQPGPEDEQVIIIRDDMTYFIVCEALGEKP